MSCVSGCMKMPKLCRRPMLSVSSMEAPIRIGRVGRRACSRGIVLVLPERRKSKKRPAIPVRFDYTDLCKWARMERQANSTPIHRMASVQNKTSMKERILETADKLFYLQGIRAIGVDTIAAEIGISKRTLYNHFPSKDALITAYL